MKRLKIESKNCVAIAAALRAVNGSADLHTFTTFTEINELAENAESALLTLLSHKKYAKGARYFSISGERVPNAYKYARKGTAVMLERGANAWFLIEIKTAVLYKEGGNAGKLKLTSIQDQRAIEILRTTYFVMQNQEKESC